MADDDLSIIAFRLATVEAKLEETASIQLEKLDQLLSNQAEYQTLAATEKLARKHLAADVKRIETDAKSNNKLANERYEKQQVFNTNTQVTLAQKVMPGATAGGLVAIIVMLVKFLVGAV